MPAAQRPTLSTGEAMALGLLQGPTELLPISSSGHTTLIPWLLGRRYATLDGELRKAFEVALHAGAGVALAVDMRDELASELAQLDARGAATAALSLVPPALTGLVLERTIERRLSGPRAIAAGLIVGAIAMAVADGGSGALDGRTREQSRPSDGLALGLAQALALLPGVSRSGAALTAARARGFRRAEAAALSWHAALPVILGASALKGWRLARAGGEGGGGAALGRGALASGGACAFFSTLLSARVLRSARVNSRPLLPYAAYRLALATLTIARLRRTSPARAVQGAQWGR
jgi:undecaprenyl-diphosphatase